MANVTPNLTIVTGRVSTTCHVVAVGKRRDGGTKYWCLLHKGDATAKYGKPAASCRYAHVPMVSSADTFDLHLKKYPGGVALWGAVPPVYDTTTLPLDRGIHVHIRQKLGGPKTFDRTYRAARVFGGSLPEDGVVVSELDAIYYMVSSIFGFGMKEIQCLHCGYSHLDKDWFSIHPHKRHLCSGCGKQFSDNEIAIGNPVSRVRKAVGCEGHRVVKAKHTLKMRQRDFKGGIQIWGSNAAFLWTSRNPEEKGIHVHAFANDESNAVVNETFSEVSIDGVRLDEIMIRTLMAQNTLPHIAGRVASINCPSCGESHFSAGMNAYTPAEKHQCGKCGTEFPSKGRIRKIVSNPMIPVLNELSSFATRPPQKHNLGLLPETL